MNELTEGVNWIAVFVSFFLSFMLGWLWYSPVMFGKKWAAGVGVSLSNASSLPVVAMVTQALATFALAWLFGITASTNAMLTIILIMVTIILFNVSNGKYAQKSNVAITIEATYIFAMGIVMFICQGIF
jgi:hypothetical protein